jgi:hypothetical protein
MNQPDPTGQTYIVGKAEGIFRIFQVRKRLGFKTYWMEHATKLWVKYNGIIKYKTEELKGRAAARRVRQLKNEGKY